MPTPPAEQNIISVYIYLKELFVIPIDQSTGAGTVLTGWHGMKTIVIFILHFLVTCPTVLFKHAIKCFAIEHDYKWCNAHTEHIPIVYLNTHWKGEHVFTLNTLWVS